MIKAIKGLFLILMLDCEESARLTSESLDRPITWSEKWALRIHQRCCRSSDRVARQMEMVSKALKDRSTTLDHAPLVADPLPVDARERIREKLRNLS